MMQQSFAAPDVIRAYGCAVFAAIVIRYVASATNPTFIHALFALLAVGATVAAYLFLARARLDSDATAANIAAAAVLGGFCFAVTSYFV